STHDPSFLSPPRPPPRSPLFPYTTLFRSRFDVVSRQGERQRRVRVVPPDEARPLLLELLLDVVPQPRHHVARAIAIDRLVQAQRDRKSTRLNSSHVAISYAVFCLKKKKKI